MKCKICEFWRKYPYRLNDRLFFEKKCREGLSLRKLELLLESYGIIAKKDLISKHIRACMNVQVSQQREIEKGIKREGIKVIGQKLRGFFIRPELPILPKTCEHRRTRYSFDHNYSSRTSDGLVWIICLDCGEVVKKFDPQEHEERMKRDPRNRKIYRSLTKK